MNTFYKVSRKDFYNFCSRIQNDYFRFPLFCLDNKKSDGLVITSYCLDDLEIAQRVKPVDKRAEYFINPFFKEA